MTCKALNDLFFTPSLWKSLVILENFENLAFLTKLMARIRWGIKKIVASAVHQYLITEILTTNATDIRLLNMMEFGQHLIPQTVKRLDLHCQTIPNLNFMIGSNITQLHLLVTIMPEVLIEVKSKCLHLSTVTLGNLRRISNTDLLEFINRDKKWTYLALLGASNINDSALHEISSCDIRHLILHSCHLITDRGISDLAGSKYLEWIKIIKCRGLSLAAFDNTAFKGTLECLMKYSDFVNGKIQLY